MKINIYVNGTLSTSYNVKKFIKHYGFNCFLKALLFFNNYVYYDHVNYNGKIYIFTYKLRFNS